MKKMKFLPCLSLCLAFLSFLILEYRPSETAEEPLRFSASANETFVASAEEKLSGELIYYTANGTKYHLRPDCRSIAGKTVYSSDKIFAESSGRTLCSVCKNWLEQASAPDSPENIAPEQNPALPETVYCTASGDKFHLDRNCRYLQNSKTVTEISREEADSKGLSPCSGCAGEQVPPS